MCKLGLSMIKQSVFKGTVSSRLLIGVLFLCFYQWVCIYRVYIVPFELVSDINQYNNHYYEGSRVFTFGFEVVVPILFELFKQIGLGFYDFVFIYSLFYLVPIFILSKYVRTIFLPLYFLFFIIWFIPNNTFLLRQYVSFYFLILFCCSSSPKIKNNFIYFVLAILSHLTAVFFLILSRLTVKRKSKYLVLALVSIIFYFLQILFFSWQEVVLEFLNWMLSFDSGADVRRKIVGQIVSMKVDDLIGISSISNTAVICTSIILHSIKIYFHGEDNKILKIFFFTSILSLTFAGLVVFSNRIGFVGYFFSIPYFCLVLSHFYLTKGFSIRIDGASIISKRIVL